MGVLLNVLVPVGLLVEEFAILHMVVWVVTGHWVWRYLGVRVSEVDIPHVLLVVKHIGVVGVIVPVVVQVVLTLIVTQDHRTHGLGHPHKDVSEEDRAQHVEPGVGGTHQLVVGMGRESLIGLKVGESLHEGNESVLHEAEAAEPEHEESGDGEGTPVSVEVSFDGLMENTIAAITHMERLELYSKLQDQAPSIGVAALLTL